ncbi:MAG: transcription elongation factor GreA [Candidatus Saccharibacteria bacterium]|nr:transcription elongation factor GreA [Candidatus Saccharibacteria bacterium]
MKKQYQITTEGRKDLETELAELKASRGAIAEKIAAARELGDLSENADYDAARDEQGQAETRIAEIEDILLNAEIIAPKKGSTVVVGSKIELKVNSKKVSYQLVGPVEADPANGKISDQSPIGKALLGKKAGESVEITTPKGKTKYVIEKIG